MLYMGLGMCAAVFKILLLGAIFCFVTCTSGDKLTITVSADPNNNMARLSGTIVVIPGTQVWLTCSIPITTNAQLSWIAAESKLYYSNTIRNDGTNDTVKYNQLRIPRASSIDSGTYICSMDESSSRNITLEVKDVHCPEISDIRNVYISYSQKNRRFNSTATFQWCSISPYKTYGPMFLTCEASGHWSAAESCKSLCKIEFLLGFNGLILKGKDSLGEGESFLPECSEGFEFSNKSDPRIYCRDGNWVGNLPPCSPARCFHQPPVPENVRIKSKLPADHRSIVEYECFDFYITDKEGTVTCWYGQWTGSPPTCKDMPTCSVESLYGIIPEGVEVRTDERIPESVPYGYVLQLACDQRGTILNGSNTTSCSHGGEWKVESDVHCVLGCASLQKNPGSELLISPEKDFHYFGDSVTFSCPEEKSLTVDTERVMCFRSGWEPDIVPDCR